VSEHALRAAVREGDDEMFLWLYDRSGAKVKAHRITRDLLWQVGRRMVDGAQGAQLTALLRANIRNESADGDLEVLEGAVTRVGGKEAVLAMYAEVLSRKLPKDVERRVRVRSGRFR
jgi:hypothetical protein